MHQRVICSVDQQQWHLHLQNNKPCINGDTRQGRKEGNNINHACIECFGAGAYIVNIMYTAFLLVVLFERVVAVELPGGGQEKESRASSDYLFHRNFSDVKVSTSGRILRTNLMMLSSICIKDVAV